MYSSKLSAQSLVQEQRIDYCKDDDAYNWVNFSSRHFDDAV